MVKAFEDPQPDYWRSYGRFQQVKHELISRYLGGWFPKLGFWAGRVIYLDTHAGRGRHVSGDHGSPLVALRTLVQHRAKDSLLDRSEFRFVFLERDADNEADLRRELEAFGTLPRGVVVDVECCDAFHVLRREVEALRSGGQQMAPAFVFVDPYGFNLPGDLLAELMQFDRVELFVNVMWRELDMAVGQAPESEHGLSQRLNRIFGGDAWRDICGDTMVERADQAAELLARRVGAKWWTHVRMVTGGDAVRFFLLHLTNHDAGRDLMKECVWKVCPSGKMSVRRSENPSQFLLIKEQPDLRGLQEQVLAKVRSGPTSRDVLQDELRSTAWLPSHLRDVEGQLVKEGKVELKGRMLSLSPVPRPIPRQGELF